MVLMMNFKEFEENVQEMKQKLQEENVDLESVQVSYTRFDGYDCLWALDGDKVVCYFKW